ncbi:MAG: phenylpyruvate tautomerase MIF-related protein [Butyricicoccus sp.]
MPYIAVNISRVLNEQEKEAIKAGLGEKISVIPGKVEKSLMVDIADGRSLYYGGKPCDGAYLDVKIYGTAAAEDKKAFIEAAFDVMEQQAGLSKKNVYITLSEFPNWGANGTMI